MNDINWYALARAIAETVQEATKPLTEWDIYKAVCAKIGDQPKPGPFDEWIESFVRTGIIASEAEKFKSTDLTRRYIRGCEIRGSK